LEQAGVSIDVETHFLSRSYDALKSLRLEVDGVIFNLVTEYNENEIATMLNSQAKVSQSLRTHHKLDHQS